MNLTYVDSSGSQNVVAISCVGSLVDSYLNMLGLIFVLGLVLTVGGIISIIYALKKNKRRFKLLGISLVVIGIILFILIQLLFVQP